jgi:signal transduction histidine kinase
MNEMQLPYRPGRGIARRIALLSWLVTIVTLVIFVVAIIPEQKRIYLENLKSKARGISASLQDVTAGAVVTEDYSSVVDHCKQVLQGDRSIYFLVITKNDGYSLIHETGGTTNTTAEGATALEIKWTTDNLGSYWHPQERDIRSGIEVVPIFERRIFHYSKPFNYSGIEWGWIHVGLSLEAYDRSVKGIYRRTTVLAVICLMFSLGSSVLYARRLVQPLLALNRIVSRVTSGDLTARAKILGRDEIQTLAHSFNTMTETLQQRDRILESVRMAAQQFLATENWREVIDGVMAKIGQAAKVSRVCVYENQTGPEGSLFATQRYEWVSPGITPQLNNPHCQQLPWREAGFETTANRLQNGELVSGLVRELSPAERALLEAQGIQSLVLVPITVEHAWWGHLGLAECAHERRWTDAESDSLRAAADMLGAAIARHRAQEALLEAKTNLEQRVLERTQELRQQMAAKERAHAELAEAQQQLVETSRMAGMAEVATGVLHNVGNVLNSVNVSTTIIREKLRSSEVATLVKLGSLLREHESDLSAFLTADSKGRLIPGFIMQLADQLAAEQTLLLKEQDQLNRNVEHIKEIVAMQQNYARVSGILEPISVASLLDDALQINAASFSRHGVRIVREYSEAPPATADKHKVLQILINLVHNAKHALDESGRPDKQLTVGIALPGNDRIQVTVSDNGVGILPENLTRIFSHGFSTRKDGHGFGLHSGANAAREMGGQLSVHSEGLGKGAAFILELPLAGQNAHPSTQPL